MADFRFNVNTRPMANQLSSVSNNVNKVSGAVVAMQAAVIAAEKDSADRICQNVNKGFYAMMQSQISQKIAQFTSVVESKLLELAQYATALQNIQTRMQSDYNMISARYTKLFQSINNSLEARVAELDMPVFKLVDTDMKVLEGRPQMSSAKFTVNQLESVMFSQLLATSKMKADAGKAIAAMTQYIGDAAQEQRKSGRSMEDIAVDSAEDIFIPVSIIESASPEGEASVTCYVARSGNEEIDSDIDRSVREQSHNSVLQGKWGEMDGKDMAKIEAEFVNMLVNSQVEERVKEEIIKMFNRTQNVQQLNP